MLYSLAPTFQKGAQTGHLRWQSRRTVSWCAAPVGRHDGLSSLKLFPWVCCRLLARASWSTLFSG